MKTDPLKRIGDCLFRSKNVLLITEGREKPPKESIDLLKKNVDNLVTIKNINRSTRQKIACKRFCLVLIFNQGTFLPHPEFQVA